MLWRRPDRFEEWLRLPAPPPCEDPRFALRRVSEADFERVYDVVTESFGSLRTRDAYEWIYGRNVSGKARCWALVERQTDRFVGVDTNFPWPMARGPRPLAGFLCGDWAIVPAWQRQGISRLTYDAAMADPWRAQQTVIGWPNLKSRGSARKGGRAHRHHGPVPRGVLPLRTRACLQTVGWAPSLAGSLGDAALAAFWTWRFGGGAAVRVEPVRRFDSGFDALTERCMAWPDYWCPHDAAFLNWRYLDNPGIGQHVALATMDDAQPTGYVVLHLNGARAWLTEFVVPERPPEIRSALMARAIGVARDAGCGWLEFFAPPRWRHWPWLRSVGFVPMRSERVLYINSPSEPRANSLDVWQLVPGDTDIL
ncbi:MAG: hypothetical protein ACHQ4J_15820 [Candidatus Binatia bacterium]